MLKKRLLTGLLTLCVSAASLLTPYKPVQAAAPSVSYSAHVSTIGWQKNTSNGGTAGTTGRNLAMEALKVNLNSLAASGVTGRAHCAGIGWQGWKTSGQTMGTTGQNRQMEAIQLKLQNGLERQYDIVYRAHISTVGWMPWVKNGATAGTTGRGLRMEAVQIKLEQKVSLSSLRYSAHVSTLGWMPYVGDGAAAGTTGREKQMEAFRAELLYGGRSAITYQLHCAEIGWNGWKTSGQIAGTVGQNRRAEAIQIKLQNGAENLYDIYYRVHSQVFGWLGWAKNGASAGTIGYGYRMEAVQIRIVPKGSAFSIGGAACKTGTGNSGSTAVSGNNNSMTNLSYGLYKSSSARITCGFNGYTTTKGKHEGIDVSRYNGAPVYSLIDGEVTSVVTGRNGSSGLSTIAIYDRSANKTVIYLHTNPVNVYAGKQISKGQQIATQGWRGVSSSSGSHTHVEVRNGKQTRAVKSVNDYNLENPNPTSYWNSKGYNIK